jgi:hypothetical protein
MFDHDIVDGAPVARFTRFKELLENGYGLCEKELNTSPLAAGKSESGVAGH